MKGAPAKPISGVEPSSATVRATASRIGSSAESSRGGAACARALALRTGDPPAPGRRRERCRRRLPARLQRDHDVGKEDAGVHVVAADRLQGDLRGQFGLQAGFEHADALAHLAVFGQRPAGLAHEPHRAAARGTSPVGGDQRGSSSTAIHQRVVWCAVNVMPSILPSCAANCNPEPDPGPNEAGGKTPPDAAARVGPVRPAGKGYHGNHCGFRIAVASHSDIDLETVALLSAGPSEVASAVLAAPPRFPVRWCWPPATATRSTARPRARTTSRPPAPP